MKKKAYVVLFIICCFIFFLNFVKPLSSDDYFLAFIWPEGVKINGILPENAVKISSIHDIFENCRQYYLIWGGHLPSSVIMSFFVWQGKELFNVFNTLVFIFLIAEIYWLSHEGRISFNIDSSWIVWIFLSLWLFNIGFNDTILWMGGAVIYLWCTMIILAYLMPYVQNYYNNKSYGENSLTFAAVMLFMGILAGCSFEISICWIIIVLTYWLYICKKNNCLQVWKVSGYLGLCLGYAVLIFAPGNYSRLTMEHKNEMFFLSYDVLKSNLMESLVILSFQIFLWYFLTKFLFKCTKDEILIDNKIVVPHINLIKVCIFIALGSSVLQFLIPSGAVRTSFVNLVFLTIAAATAFRVLEQTGTTMIQNNAKSFLKTIGYSFLVVTMCCSAWGNYINWCHWNSILALVEDAHKNRPDIVLEVAPYPVSSNSVINLLSGFHIFDMPFRGTTENDEINRSFARYYGIKGIKVSY